MKEPRVGDQPGRNEPGLPADSALPPRAAEPGGRPGVQPGAVLAAQDALWDVAAVAAFLRIPIGSIYKMTARKAVVRIPHIRLGGLLRFRRSDVEQWLALLTVSNLTTLSRIRDKTQKGIHGDHSQTSP